MGTFTITNAGGISPIKTYTWANKPLASSAPGVEIFCSDIAAKPMRIVSDGTQWIIPNCYLSQQGLPLVLAASGTIANNGALTIGTALPAVYSSCYIYLPDSAIFTGSTAGLYYAVMSSSTAGTLYNNVYTSGNVEIPDTPVAFVSTGPGAYTQTTVSAITLKAVTLRGGLLGTNGQIIIQNDWFATVNANAKTATTKLDSATLHTATLTSFAVFQEFFSTRNRGIKTKQLSSRNNTSIGGTSATSAYTLSSVDTTADVVLSIQVSSATATDNIVLEGGSIHLIP
jgi:hypothetical protein